MTCELVIQFAILFQVPSLVLIGLGAWNLIRIGYLMILFASDDDTRIMARHMLMWTLAEFGGAFLLLAVPRSCGASLFRL